MSTDSAALASAAAAAQEALQLERAALAVLREGWSGESASAAAEFIDAHCQEGEALVSALRHAADLLAAVGDPSIGGADEVQARLDERPPANFASSMPPAAAQAAPATNWPSVPMPALPDIGGAISALIAEAADALNTDSADSAGSTDTPVQDTPSAVKKAPAVPLASAPVSAPPAPSQTPAGPPVASPPLLPAEMAPPQPAADPVSVPDRTPCEIAADELPQVGE